MSVYRESDFRVSDVPSTLEERIIRDLVRAFRHGTDVSTVVIHPSDMQKLLVEMGAKVIYQGEHLVFMGVGGPIAVTSSVDVPPGVIQLG